MGGKEEETWMGTCGKIHVGTCLGIHAWRSSPSPTTRSVSMRSMDKSIPFRRGSFSRDHPSIDEEQPRSRDRATTKRRYWDHRSTRNYPGNHIDPRRKQAPGKSHSLVDEPVSLPRRGSMVQSVDDPLRGLVDIDGLALFVDVEPGVVYCWSKSSSVRVDACLRRVGTFRFVWEVQVHVLSPMDLPFPSPSPSKRGDPHHGGHGPCRL